MSLKDRKYRRIILPKEKRAEARILLVPDESAEKSGSRLREFDATVMNFSEGGLGFSMQRTGFWKLCSLDRIRISGISGEHPFDEMEGLTLEVKWVLDSSELSHIGFGCEFKDINDELREKVRQYLLSF